MKHLRKPANLVWLIAPIILWWILRHISLAEILTTLRQLNLWQIILLFAFNVLIFFSFSSRWWLILRAQGLATPYLSLSGYRLVAFAISYFTPGTQFGGEPFQVLMLEKEQRIPAGSALASVSLDKIFELLANFTFLAIGSLLILNSRLLLGLTGFGALLGVAVLLVMPLAYLFALWRDHVPLSALSTRLSQKLRRKSAVQRGLVVLLEAESQISSVLNSQPGAILWAFVLSGLFWVLMIGEYWLSLYMLGIQLTLQQALILLTAARLAFLTPLPGGLGALEASQMLAMQSLGFNPTIGISLSLMIRARDISFGLLGMGWGAVLTRRLLPVHSSPIKIQENEIL